MRRTRCGVPYDECNGAMCSLDKHSVKVHADPFEAFACYTAYLKKQGYQKVGERAFRLGEGPVLILTKKSRFGQQLRLGKTGNDSSIRSTARWTRRGKRLQKNSVAI